MSLTSLLSRIAFFSESNSAPQALPFSSSQESARKQQRGRGSWHTEMSELMLVQPPHASLSPQREASPVIIFHPNQRHSAAVSDLVSFSWSEDDRLPLMSRWPSTSAHPLPSAGRRRSPTRPSLAGCLQPSLDGLIPWLNRQPRCFTPWWSSRAFRPNTSATWTSLTLTLQHLSSCDLPGSAHHQDHGPDNQSVHGQPSGARAPLVFDSNRDQGCR